jgi:four helix bundle protein
LNLTGKRYREKRLEIREKDMPIKTYKDLIVWQKAVELVKEIYRIAKQLPDCEKYILVPQMIRAAISIAANIAEGWARNHKAEFIRFISISYGSASELETHLIVAKSQYPNIDYFKSETLVVEVEKMLSKLMSNTKSSEKKW